MLNQYDISHKTRRVIVGPNLNPQLNVLSLQTLIFCGQAKVDLWLHWKTDKAMRVYIKPNLLHVNQWTKVRSHVPKIMELSNIKTTVHTHCGPFHGRVVLVRQKSDLQLMSILDTTVKCSKCSSIMAFSRLWLVGSSKHPLPHKRWIIY